MESSFGVKIDEYLPLRDVVFYTLRQAILRGELKPGERLLEIRLANKLGVSRTPVREAIRKLEMEGLVKLVPRRGAEVAEITEKRVRDALEVRRALEELAVQLACERISNEELEELKKAEEHFSQVLGKVDLVEVAAADESFHDVIFKATDNDRLTQLLNNLREQIYRYRLEYLKEESYHEILLQEHQQILERIRDRDKEKATEAIDRHIDNQVATIMAMLRKKEA